MEIETWLGDITTLQVDAIVNAANDRLAAGAGVCGAIHHAAGPELAQACDALGGCETGDAVATDAYALPARWVIHAVGPVWNGGTSGEVELLASAYRRSIEVADDLGATRELLGTVGAGANLVNDAHLAALAIEHNAQVMSYDNDFGRFPGVGRSRPPEVD